MTNVVARLSALALFGLLALSIAALVITSRGGVSERQLQAELIDARPLLEGMNVRVSGAVEGSVHNIELTDRGTALVTMNLSEELEPKADASVAIRQQDILGDSFVSLDIGESERPLEGPIPPERTIAMPRTDDIFNTFTRPVRTGLRAVLTELGLALESRGDDLNEAILRLRPGLSALDELLGELEGQNVTLKQVLEDAQAFTGQAASRSEEAGELVDALDRLLAETALRAPALDRALERLPETLSSSRATLARVEAVSRASRPLAGTLSDTAPGLRRTASLVGPFAHDASAAARDLGPTIHLLGRSVEKAGPALDELGRVDLRALVPAVDLLATLRPVLVDLADGIFGADSYGQTARGQKGLGATAVERGDQPSDRGADPARNYIRTAYVPSCETFGEPIRPGCLEDFLADAAPESPARRRSKRVERRPGGRPDRAPAYEDRAGSPTAQPPRAGLPGLDELDALARSIDEARRGVDRTARELRRRVDEVGRGVLDRARERITPGPGTDRLLDFLLGP